MDDQKELEELMEKIFEVDQLDVPPSNFTYSVLNRLAVERKEKLIYRPLLPKWLLVIIGVFILILTYVVLSVFAVDSAESSYNLSFYEATSWLSHSLVKIDISNVLGYYLLAMGLMICVQAFVINKRYGTRTTASI